MVVLYVWVMMSSQRTTHAVALYAADFALEDSPNNHGNHGYQSSLRIANSCHFDKQKTFQAHVIFIQF
jgi:hypothetical protein